MNMKTIEDVFIHLLSDTYSAEKQLTWALAKLARATSNEKLSQAFHAHLEETHGQIERIDQVVESESNLKIKRMKCVAMEGSDSNLLIVFYVQIMPDDLVMQLHRF